MSLRFYVIPFLASTIIWSRFAPSASADLVISSVGIPVVITFDATLANVNQDGFRGEGLSPTPTFGQLDSDSWEIDAGSQALLFGQTSATSPSFFASTDSIGAVTVSGVYSFDTGGGNRTLGIQPHVDDFTPGTITLRVLNATGTTVSSWNVGYDIFAYNDTNASTSIDFSYAVGTTTPGSFASLPLLDFDSPSVQDAIAAWAGPTAKSTSISASVPTGTNLFLRWTIDSTGNTLHVHDEIGLDNISVTAAVPEPNAALFVGLVASLSCFAALTKRLLGTSRRS